MTIAVDHHPAHSAPATPPARQRWRRPAPGKPAQRQALAVACEVEQMAVEAAQILRTRRWLHEGADCDVELVAALDALEAGPSADELHQALIERQRGLEENAGHRRATSIKGALFQLYLAASRSQYPQGHLLTKLTPHEDRILAANDRNVGRLHQSAVGFLETLAWDDDLAQLRAWYCAKTSDLGAACDLAMTDRERLLAEARAQVAAETAARG